MNLSIPEIAGLLASILGIAALAIYSGTKPQTYANVNRSPIIAGILMGTLVGGSSTVGTAQLAYNYGLSAWWFTIGGGIACLIVGLIYCVPWRKSGCMTLNGIISKEYGSAAGMASSLLTALGTFINIISQLIAGTAVISVVLPAAGLVPALVITAAFMALYVIFGGTQGAGMVGILKLVLLYVSMIGCGIIVLVHCGGVDGFMNMVKGIDNPGNINFMSLFARGVGKDASACLSLILGVLTTQTYAQALMSGKSDRDARTGALISAVLIPPIGTGGILVGLYMRAHYPDIAAKTALTTFATELLPDALGGLVLGTLFIAVVGTGAGLAMGISTILRREIFSRYSDRLQDPKVNGKLSKIVIVLVLALAVYMSSGSLGDTILNFAFMSMGLRGAVLFVPMCCALWLPGKVNNRWALAATIAGPVFVLVFGTIIPLPAGVDSLFIGIAAAFICCCVGLAIGKNKAGVKLISHANAAADKLIVTIDSEVGSGSREIALALSKELNIPCYDKEILTKAASLSKIDERLLVKYDGIPVMAAYDLNAKDESSINMPSAGEFIGAQMAACKHLAEESCILLDRFASKAMEKEPGCIKIFIHADFESRVHSYAEKEQLGPAAARRKLRRVDRVRKRYHKGVDKNWGSAANYAISINSTGLEPETIARNILRCLNVGNKQQSA